MQDLLWDSYMQLPVYGMLMSVGWSACGDLIGQRLQVVRDLSSWREQFGTLGNGGKYTKAYLPLNLSQVC